MKAIIFFSISLAILNLNAQTNKTIQTYTFVEDDFIDSFNKKTNTAHTLEKNSTKLITVSRHYINDSTFKEYGYFQDTTHCFNFQINGEKWFLKQNNKYVEFFNDGDQTSSKFYLLGNACSMVWEKACKWDNTDTYILNLFPPKNNMISHIPIYFFNPEFGIVGIMNNGRIFMRIDLVGNSLVHFCR